VHDNKKPVMGEVKETRRRVFERFYRVVMFQKAEWNLRAWSYDCQALLYE
jgi:hypothetical protein